ncbi:MAG: mitochondrial aspartate-glutamate transporter agc1 [Watsoniomyces obsoletus]|nr:MAG: mitochondrial aspartate-glutamate transporter agc1 [Watsoniomyces obsoletus]
MFILPLAGAAAFLGIGMQHAGAFVLPSNQTSLPSLRVMECTEVPTHDPKEIPVQHCLGVDLKGIQSVGELKELVEEQGYKFGPVDRHPLRKRDEGCNLECQTDHLLFDSTLSDFIEARKKKEPTELDWNSDACTDSPDRPFGFNFANACNRHDFGYQNYHKQHRFTEQSHERIDELLRTDFYTVCSVYDVNEKSTRKSRDCRRLANLYFAVVRIFSNHGSEQDDPDVVPQKDQKDQKNKKNKNKKHRGGHHDRVMGPALLECRNMWDAAEDDESRDIIQEVCHRMGMYDLTHADAGSTHAIVDMVRSSSVHVLDNGLTPEIRSILHMENVTNVSKAGTKPHTRSTIHSVNVTDVLAAGTGP